MRAASYYGENFNYYRSPGGTPLRCKTYDIDAASNDPAAIIAQALRKKFSHKVFQDSPGKFAQYIIWDFISFILFVYAKNLFRIM